MQDNKLVKLRKFNLIMGLVHFVQGVLMLILASTVIQKISEFKPMITQNYLFFNNLTNSLELTSKELFALPFGVLVALFLLISAGAHMLISIPNKMNDIYNKDLKKVLINLDGLSMQ